jgi:hypothetical protein
VEWPLARWLGGAAAFVARGTLGPHLLCVPSYLRACSRHPDSASPQSTPRDEGRHAT